MPSTEVCSESVLMSSLCFPVTILIAAPGTSEVSNIWYISTAGKGNFSEGITIRRFPWQSAAAISVIKEANGAMSGHMIPTTPTGSFSAMVFALIGAWWTTPSNLSAHEEKVNNLFNVVSNSCDGF